MSEPPGDCLGWQPAGPVVHFVQARDEWIAVVSSLHAEALQRQIGVTGLTLGDLFFSFPKFQQLDEEIEESRSPLKCLAGESLAEGEGTGVELSPNQSTNHKKTKCR